LEQAKQTLRTLLHGNATDEYMAELSAYWSSTAYCLIDDLEPNTTVTFGICSFDKKPQILIAGKSDTRLSKWAKTAGGTFESLFTAPVLHANSVIRPPTTKNTTLKSATDWLDVQVETNRTLLETAIGDGVKEPSALIVGANAIIGFRAKRSLLMSNIEEGSFRKLTLPKLWQKEASKCEIERFHCVRSTQLEVTDRNLDRNAPLTGLRIAIVGCGTIGGYLARALVQLGAGHKGKLLLVDSDVFRPENLGRHILSVRHLSRNKASALGDQLQSDFPDLSVEAIAASAQANFDRLTGYDLVVDATGDQQFSDALNAFALKFTEEGRSFPPTLFAMIFGNGVAAQSFLTSWTSTSACYRCLKPNFDQDWRFSPVKSSTDEVFVSVRPCSRGAFIPYGVSASMHAAALAAGHLIDFFSEGYRDALRSVHIVPDKTKGKLRRSVNRAVNCPACSLKLT